MVNAIQPSSFGNVPGPGTEQLSASVLREINKTNTEQITTRLEISRKGSQVPGPPEIPPENEAFKPSLKNLLIDEGRDPASPLDSFIEKTVEESIVNFVDEDRGEFVNQRV